MSSWPDPRNFTLPYEEKLQARIDLSVLQQNFRTLRAYAEARPRRAGFCLPPAPGFPRSQHTGHPICVVKADAYGHGAPACAQALAEAGADFVAVSSLREALEIRCAVPRADILVLAPSLPENAPLFVRFGITATLTCSADGLGAAEAVRRAVEAGHLPPGAALSAHIKLNSGMNRLGFPLTDADAPDTLQQILALGKLPHLRLSGVFSHLAAADQPAEPATTQQCRRFFSAVAFLHGAGLCPVTHLANTAAMLRFGDMGCSHYRIGIGLYGLPPSRALPFPPSIAPAIRAPMSLTARVTQVFSLRAGERVGYGGLFRAPADMRAATVGIGYADGLLRACSGACLRLHGQDVPIIGRISMDQCTLDIRDIEAKPGDEVTVLEASGRLLSALAEKADSIPYELLCLSGRRAERVYTRGAHPLP